MRLASSDFPAPVGPSSRIGADDRTVTRSSCSTTLLKERLRVWMPDLRSDRSCSSSRAKRGLVLHQPVKDDNGRATTCLVQPAPLTLLERGSARVHARALVASLPEGIGKREMSVVRDRLGLDRSLCRVETVDESVGPGNVLIIVVEGEPVTEVVTGFGIKGVTAEKVASDACDEAERYLCSDVPVGIHLADQLLVPMALAGGGSFRTLPPTPHTVTNAGVVQRFLNVSIAMDTESCDACRITVRSP